MSVNSLFVLSLGLILYLFLAWGFKRLPKEKWQILACVPKEKKEGQSWQGINYTYYGFLQATAYIFAVSLLMVLLGSLAVPKIMVLTLIVFFLTLCAPLSKLIARVVEGKPFTFTVGGASFAGLILSPWLIWATNATLGRAMVFQAPLFITITVIAIAYVMGEGMGRLSCLSFGCCYGKPISQSHPLVRKIFPRFYVVFTGRTKKIAYAHNLDGQPVIPVQAMTSVIYTGAGLGGIYLFLEGFYCAAFFLVIGVSQVWRFLSEFLRADFRGEQRISGYQIMALTSLFYAAGLPFVFPPADVEPARIMVGLASLWSPDVIIFLQLLWLAIFIFTGRSRVTGADLTLYVVRDMV